jgi:hypothetical protein
MTEELPAALVAPTHSMRLTIEVGSVVADWTCIADEGAACRMTCPEGCETWDDDHWPHRLVDKGECNAVEWLDNDAWDETYGGDPEHLRSGPVEVWWNGDGYSWRYPQAAQAVRSPEAGS